ncbi:MAG TPA: hypothetical protein VNT99_05760 [Methylomirabilota bacterium]|nr:hypothetical protein [Methylomirabilota bacterium]
MNWLPWLLAMLAVLPIAQLIIDYRVKYFAKDGRTKEHKVLRTIVLTIALVSLAANPFVGWINNVQKDRKAEKEGKALKGQITDLKSNFQFRISLVDSNQLRFKDDLQSVSMALATNSSMDPSVRAKLLQASKRLEAIDTNIIDTGAWISDLQRNRALRRLELSQSDQSHWDEGLPVYDYAIRKLQSTLVELGKQNGNQVFSDFKTLPVLAPPYPFDAAKLAVGTNSQWKFEAIIEHTYHTQLRITSTCADTITRATMRLQVYDGSVVADVEALGQLNIEEIGKAEGFKTTVDWALRGFIAAHIEQCTAIRR